MDRRIALCVFLTAAAACGRNSGDTSEPPGSTGTLAYVVSRCSQNVRTTAESYTQQLLVQRRDADPIVVMESPTVVPPEPTGSCLVFGTFRSGDASVFGSPFQRLGVSPDGSRVVFEVTDDFSMLPSKERLSEEQKGIYVVGADGSALRRLGPASRYATFRSCPQTDGCSAAAQSTETPLFHFSPSGNRITYADKDPDGDSQIVTLNIDTEEQTWVTRLRPEPELREDCCQRPYFFAAPPVFLDEETIGFATAGGPAGAVQYAVKADGQTDPVLLPPAVELPGSIVVPDFSITGSPVTLYTLRVSGTQGFDGVQELFLLFGAGDGKDIVQLTNFGRGDTAIEGGVLSRNRRRVLFSAAENPVGRNKHKNCQFFSVDTLGSDLQQLTTFDEGGPSSAGCGYSLPPEFGCFPIIIGYDLNADDIIFQSNCDPLGRNPNGSQIFAMGFDGGDIRQLTDAAGFVMTDDGITVELVGPAAYTSP